MPRRGRPLEGLRHGAELYSKLEDFDAWKGFELTPRSKRQLIHGSSVRVVLLEAFNTESTKDRGAARREARERVVEHRPKQGARSRRRGRSETDRATLLWQGRDRAACGDAAGFPSAGGDRYCRADRGREHRDSPRSAARHRARRAVDTAAAILGYSSS